MQQIRIATRNGGEKRPLRMFPDFFGRPCKIFLVYYRLKSSVYFDHMKHFTSAILRALNDEWAFKGTELNAEDKKLSELIEENGILVFVRKNRNLVFIAELLGFSVLRLPYRKNLNGPSTCQTHCPVHFSTIFY